MKKIISWNINGIASWSKNDESLNFLKKENPDIFCIQEIKSSQDKFDFDDIDFIASKFPKESSENIKKFLSQYPYQYYYFAEKKGYSGVGVFSRIKPQNVFFGLKDEKDEDIDKEGRLIVLEFEKMFLVNVYTPNSKIDFSRIDYRINVWDKNFKRYLSELKNKKNIIVCGDMNVLALDIDLQNYNFYFKNSKFREKILKERESFETFLNLGLVDIYRKKFPEKIIFSWTAPIALQLPSTRLDYFLIDKKIENNVDEVEIVNNFELQKSSDHFPILLKIKDIINEETNFNVNDKEKIIFPKNENEELFQDSLF